MAVTPPTPPARDPRILAEFRERRHRQILVTVVWVLGVIGFMWLQERSSSPMSRPAVTGVFFGLLILLIAFAFTNWRCPACRRYLGRGLGPKFCPGCGVPLQ